MIEAGTEKQFVWGGGNWIFLDIGFSGAKDARGRTCGLVIGDAEPGLLNFAEAKKRIVDYLVGSRALVNLVIEAPLSVCFNAEGLPTGRSIETRDGKNRFWYVGAGCSMMVASMYLLSAILEALPRSTIRLFEAFISYKDADAKSDHKREAKTLRDAVRSPGQFPCRKFAAHELKTRTDDDLFSAFRVLGADCGVPAVIML